MHEATHMPAELQARILGDATIERQRLLARIDVVVGYVAARNRVALGGWDLHAALVEERRGFRGGETVALQARPADGRSVDDVAPFPARVLHELALRLMPMEGLARVVPDMATPAPDVIGTHAADRSLDELGRLDDPGFGGAQIA